MQPPALKQAALAKAGTFIVQCCTYCTSSNFSAIVPSLAPAKRLQPHQNACGRPLSSSIIVTRPTPYCPNAYTYHLLTPTP